MFAGSWTRDSALLGFVNPPGGEFTLRLLTLGIYGVMFLAALLVSRTRLQPARMRAFLVASIVLTGGLYLCGCLAVVVLGIFPHLASALRPESAESAGLALAFFVAMKSIGAPLSAAFACLFARMPYRLITRATIAGILGAFVVEGIARSVADGRGLSDEALFFIGAGFIAAAWVIALMLVRRGAGPGCPPDALGPLHGVAAPSPQPLSVIANRNLALGVVVASMMLGFLRTGALDGQGDMLPAVIVTFIVIAALVLVAGAVGMQELFRGALICSAAAFLLGPLLNPFIPDASNIFAGIGTGLFEAVVWMVGVLIVRGCTNQLVAAAGARLAVVVGHLVGAGIGIGAGRWEAVHPEESGALSLAIVFAYVLMLTYLFSDPVAKLPFTAGRVAAEQRLERSDGGLGGGHSPETHKTPDASAEATKLAKPVKPARPAKPARVDDARLDALLWKEPCDSIGREASLTPRERDILEQLAQGRDLAFMEEKFVLSRNTVKMHVKHVYAKLNVHSKQEVIDLVVAARERR